MATLLEEDGVFGSYSASPTGGHCISLIMLTVSASTAALRLHASACSPSWSSGLPGHPMFSNILRGVRGSVN